MQSRAIRYELRAAQRGTARCESGQLGSSFSEWTCGFAKAVSRNSLFTDPLGGRLEHFDARRLYSDSGMGEEESERLSRELLERVADRLDLEADHLRVREVEMLRWKMLRIADPRNDEPLDDQLEEISLWVPEPDLSSLIAEERTRLIAPTSCGSTAWRPRG